jgi:pimeloyl-ACP methyl ester carboxylesterase
MSTDPRLCDVTFNSAEVALAGSLAVPDQVAPSAGVVMVGGSGPSDRTNDTYFTPIRRHLAGAGMAVLSYDKRGVGASSGDWRDATMDDLAADAVAALGFLRAQPGVRVDAVGLFGHSEGGWVVLRAATGRDDVPWVITNSCPGMTPAAQDRYALANALRQAGAIAQREIDSTLACYDRVVEAGRRDIDFAGVSELVRFAEKPSLFADHYWGDVDERLWEFLKRKQDHDPVPDALGLRCPHLAIFGGEDQLVPVAESIHLFSAAVCHADRHHRATLTVEVFPGADHRVQTNGGTRLAPGYLTILTQWVKHRTAIDPDA